jgi:CRISPR-associated protein (TIGR03986 family)
VITSAYNFSPLRTVLSPDWHDLVSQDVPLRDGLCAEVDFSLTNHTPLLVGGGEDADPQRKTFHRHPDGTPAIPGSSLRGMVRNVMEIVTRARMRFIDDRALSLRDLYLAEYKALFQRPPEAGWLRFDPAAKNWVIHVVEFGRIDYADMALVPFHGQIYKAWSSAAGDDKRKALLKYRAIGRPPRVRLEPADAGPDRTPAYRVCGEKNAVRTGYIVFTGQPGGMDSDPDPRSHKKHNKHREFVFLDPKAQPREDQVGPALPELVPSEVMQRFLQVHEQSDDWHYLSSEQSVLKKAGVPVFFHREPSHRNAPGAVASMGLAMMYRIPGKRTLGQMARAQQKAEGTGPDFVETLFGAIDGGAGSRFSHRSRVSFGDVRWTGPGTQPPLASENFRRPTLLGQPKPSFYPSYIVQKHQDGRVQEAYQTILSKDVNLRGWKRYPVRPQEMVSLNVANQDNSKVNVRLEPLAAGQQFTGLFRLHNVKLEELGAVLWCLTWGGNASLRHSLGMGKPFGFGQVSLSLGQVKIRPNDPEQQGAWTAAGAVAAFETWMDGRESRWRDDLVDLLAMADPSLADKANLRPLTLGMKAHEPNEFNEAKRQQQALKPYSQLSASLQRAQKGKG